jgi:hypothetical protein
VFVPRVDPGAQFRYVQRQRSGVISSEMLSHFSRRPHSKTLPIRTAGWVISGELRPNFAIRVTRLSS